MFPLPIPILTINCHALTLVPMSLTLVPFTLTLVPFTLTLVPFTLTLVPFTLTLVPFTLTLVPLSLILVRLFFPWFPAFSHDSPNLGILHFPLCLAYGELHVIHRASVSGTTTTL